MLKMKKILLVLVSLFAAAELAWAAVTPIADTPFNSNFSVKSAEAPVLRAVPVRPTTKTLLIRQHTKGPISPPAAR